MATDFPFRRLASFYFFHYATLGALVPYWSLYMDLRGFSAVQIGQVMAIILAGRVVAPTLWGWLADRLGRSGATMTGAAALSLLAFLAVSQVNDFLSLVFVMGLFSIGFSGVIPQFEATTFNHLGAEPEQYGRVRLWGSVGFIVAVFTAGFVFDEWQVSQLPWVVSMLLACMLLATWLTPASETPVAELDDARQIKSLWSILAERQVQALLLACFLVQASFGPYYVFFSVYLDELGYPAGAIGALWALAVASEILVFMFARRMFRRYSLRGLFRVAVGLCIVRWLATGALAQVPAVLIIAQLTHLATFGIYHAVAVSLIHRYFTGPLQVRGQGLYSSLSFGAGGVVGSIMSGYAWQHLGAAMTYYFAAVFAALAFLVTVVGMRTLQNSPTSR